MRKPALIRFIQDDHTLTMSGFFVAILQVYVIVAIVFLLLIGLLLWSNIAA